MAPTRTTRRSQSLESSSDDGDNLDEEDNMYVDNVLSDLDDLQDNSDDDDDEDDNTVVAGSSQKDSEGLAQFLENIHWNFCAEVALLDEEPPLPYNGPSGLKPRVAESFDDPFQCLAICGGLDYDLVCRLARNSNEYVRHHLLPKDRNNRLHGKAYANITAEEMYHFLGITLRISLSPVDYGGYEAYFSAQDRKILNKHIFASDGFARHFMTLSRYKQIRTAFHPEDRTGGMEGDKCYQLRHAINTINKAALNAKHIGEDVTFDEGGIGSRHRMNPVRQYNKDKPQKYRVDFFIMACSKSYFIHHIDVYQGANASNVGLHRAVRDLPTTQRAVLNAVLHTGMHNEVHGARHISLDNRYQCPELAYILRQKMKIYSTGTCRQNRKGWDKAIMNLNKNDGRGKYKFAVDNNNKVLCCQWVDSKVVNCVSSILSYEIKEIKRQVGSDKKTFTCPMVLTRYQQNMIGVDKSDQMRAAGGGFAAKAHYKKWYKRAYFAILDMMTLNALIAWNLSTKTTSRRSTRVPLRRHEFLWYIAQCMLDYKDENVSAVEDVSTSVTTKDTTLPTSLSDGHTPIQCTDAHARCAVCRLDFNIERTAKKFIQQQSAMSSNKKIKQSQKNMANQLSTCNKCKITAHPSVPNMPRKIHGLPAFEGLTCFQIAHTVEGYDVWKRCNSQETTHGRAYMPKMTHPICNNLRELHGLPPLHARKRKRKNIAFNDEDDEEDSDIG
jgi:Transposase IS4